MLDAGEPTKQTSAVGRYRFRGLDPGPYTVSLVPDAGLLVRPALGVVPSGTAVTNVNPTTFRPVTIRGKVFHDADRDGTLDPGEVVQTGVVVYLDLDSDGVRDAGEPFKASNARGVYRFRNQPPGTYRVRQEVPSGFTQTSPR
jgi:protocatechuate 3,4-dioxygenase beta subunit